MKHNSSLPGTNGKKWNQSYSERLQPFWAISAVVHCASIFHFAQGSFQNQSVALYVFIQYCIGTSKYITAPLSPHGDFQHLAAKDIFGMRFCLPVILGWLCKGQWNYSLFVLVKIWHTRMGANKICVDYTDIIIVIFLFVCFYINMCACGCACISLPPITLRLSLQPLS